MKNISLLICIIIFSIQCFGLSFNEIYRGKIDNKYPITVSLTCKNNSLSGYYYYDRYKTPITISGYISGDKIQINGYIKYKKIDSFEGKYSENKIEGIWTGDKNKKAVFVLTNWIPRDEQKREISNNNYLYFAIGICVIVALFFAIRSRKLRNPATLIPPTIPDKDSVEKGNLFEKYIISLFPREYYTLNEWRSDKIHNGISPESNKNPDLEYERTNTHHEKKIFAVECKYRSSTSDDKITIARKDQVKRYSNYSKAKNIPVYVVIGLGGTPSDPEKLYIIPLERISKEVIHIKELQSYSIKKKSYLYYDPEKNTLK
jgi:hypothetical protein